MLNAFASARLWLAQIDPLLPAALLVVIVFATVYSIRRWFPRVWLLVEKTVPFAESLDFTALGLVIWKSWQALPGMLFGAAVAAISTGGNVRAALWGVASGALASLAHEVMATYKGQVSVPKPRGGGMGPMGGVLALWLVMFTSGCALFGKGGSVWPALGACTSAVSETLFSEVESVLTSSGGSYEDDLLALGKTEGLSLVECAVKSVVDALSARIAARAPGARITPDEGIGVARGKAFLAKIEEAHK